MSGNTNTFNTDPDNGVIHPTSRQLFRTWERLRGENSAPLRSQMTISELSAIIPWVCILHRDLDRMSYVFRLAGSAVCDIWGRPLTQSVAFQDWSSFDRETIVRALDTVVGMKQPCVARFVAYSFGGREVGFELLAVPVLAANGKDVHAMLTIAPFRDRRGLEADPLVDFQIRKIKVLWTDELPGEPVRTKAFSNDDVKRMNTSFLRVIDGGKI
ncbi:MAG: PAS domain-containing protein [Anderseniella sp.]